jgi:hypothetical protein
MKQNDLNGKHVNKWLIDETFQANQKNINDSFYLKLLGDVLYTFLVKKCPVQVKTELNNNSIRFKIGQEISKDFIIDNSIHPDDFVLKLEQWLSKYYPQYSCEVEKLLPLTEEEKTSIFLTSEFDNIDKAINKMEKGKSINEIEKMIITRIILLKDKFKVFINNIPYIYSTRKIKLSKFLSDFRKLNTNEEKKKFFDMYSIKVKRIGSKPFYFIDRRDDELLSFFKIYKDNSKASTSSSNGYLTGEGDFIEDNEGEYTKWDNFVFKIKSEYVRKNFIDIIKTIKLDKGEN